MHKKKKKKNACVTKNIKYIYVESVLCILNYILILVIPFIIKKYVCIMWYGL